MSWQEQVYMRLCQESAATIISSTVEEKDSRGERRLSLGELFEGVQRGIPLHFAMRYAVRKSPSGEMPSGIDAIWKYFKFMLNRMNVERIGPSKCCTYADQVRLRPAAERACTNCAGPVVWATWTGRTNVVCLACEAAKRQ